MQPITPRKTLGNNIRRLRLATGLSQEELADRAELHRTYISSVERGERNVSVDNIFLLARALGVEAADLVTETTDSEAG